ncbi:MAG: hypothetical protein ACLUEQ_07085 [Cloacibacillus evryensis]
MTVNPLDGQKDIASYEPVDGRLFSATHEEILTGWTTDIYFLKTRDVLRSAGLLETPVVAEVFTRKPGTFAGSEEVLNLFRKLPNPPRWKRCRRAKASRLKRS